MGSDPSCSGQTRAAPEAGKLPIDRLITRRIALDEVNSAFDDMGARRGGRAVIVYD